MTDTEVADALVELTRLEAQVTELKGRVAAHADEQQVGQDRGASSTAAWLAYETKQTRPATHRMVRLGQDLQRHPITREALAAAVICPEQAAVILRWVDTLPEEIDQQLRDNAERHLLELAKLHDAKGLNRLGRRLWEVIDPDGADAREAGILERQEAKALRSMYLKVWDDGEGSTCGSFKMPHLGGAALRKILAAVMAAKHQNATKGAGTGHLAAVRTGPEAQGQAFYELLMRYPASKLPKIGGLNATLLVTISEESLLGRLEQAGTILDTGDRISPALARKLACEAGILPVVMNGKSEVLDLGREQRLHSQAQRIAITLRQHGQCATDGCDRTTGLHAHHVVEWSKGGPTDLANAIGLCHWHHMKAHDNAYGMSRGPTGSVTFHRRE
ncbi:HNH endonuclease [Nocardioides mangrovi]|uniref:HNH endonuclease n=1 Tax=Nocardioides mangrovi TaxID=2874580 RepID=A0ABS7UCN9_9ACTN|nr:HNH endonuclease signature motif containing protein [Nocardioides mangrovi]MBZ5738605.1 HNH endonuclease [Nocardioides mangrovi]